MGNPSLSYKLQYLLETKKGNLAIKKRIRPSEINNMLIVPAPTDFF